MSDEVTMSQSEYGKMKLDQDLLEALRQTGVDNWDGWGDALELFYSWQEDTGE